MTLISIRRSALVSAGTLLVGFLAGAAASAAVDGPSVAASDRAAIEAIVRDYILNHPEILPEAMQRLASKEQTQAIASNRTAIETPFTGAWAGAAKGDVVLVEFTDYACGFCRKSEADVARLLAEDKNLKVVWRELPIIGADSEPAARLALAAAKRGKYAAVHSALFAGQLTEGRIAAAAKAAGIAEAEGKAADIEAELGNNLALARALGVTGTPAFVVGDRMLSGAVGYEALKQAIADARKRG